MASLGKLDKEKIKRKLMKLAYFAGNISRELVPQAFFRRRLRSILETVGRYDRSYIEQRVNYYNKLSEPLTDAQFSAPVPPDVEQFSSTIGQLPMSQSLFYFDTMEHARYFPRHFRLNYIFGDGDKRPLRPSFVKARPIRGDNRNAVLLNLDKFRHFYFPRDRIAFDDKKPIAVWRGAAHNEKRVTLLQRYQDHPLCDIGHTYPKARLVGDCGALKPFLSIPTLMQFRYVISIEGFDVATNLKWILASNCLCLMPKPTRETWFMEGRLEAGIHYAELRDDFEDLEAKILYYEHNRDEAMAIIRNANVYAAQFQRGAREQLLSLLVMYKYFVLSGQLEPEADLWMAFSRQE